MAISSQQVIGTAGATSGDIWTADDVYASDQYSQIAGDLDAADRGAVDRGGGAAAGRRAEVATRACTTGISAARC